MDQVRVAIVGMGIGKSMAAGFAGVPRAKVTALCDVVEERMEAFAATELSWPVKYYTDYVELCKDPEIDAIFVGTPNQMHVPIALEAIRNRKPVLVIKPLADSLPAAQELVTAAEASGVVNMIAMVARHAPSTRYVQQMIADGDFGEIYHARARTLRRTGIPGWNTGFISMGGGVFRDIGVHALDAAWWMMGMPKPVSVIGTAGAKFGPRGQGYWDLRPALPGLAAQFAVDDYASGFIRFDNGAGLQIETFWAGHQPDERVIELFGTEAGMRLDPLMIYRTLNGAPVDTTVTFPKGPTPWEHMANHFVECILDDVPCESPLRHGMIVQEMLEAVLDSGATGQEIRLNYD
ncbi:MAG: Gfo/Idh/MocA family oxidoreductase [Herpetosiphonaceae bacterium]|nr:Gfo/Idh/MocA family oxidoreductase [Herpetosiphonaceae bacterium]